MKTGVWVWSLPNPGSERKPPLVQESPSMAVVEADQILVGG